MYTHNAASADWTTRRYRHNSLYLQVAQTRPGLVIKALVKANVEACERFYLDLFCRCSSSLLSKITDIFSVRTSFFFPSFRTPEIFCPFSTVTSKISVQGRIQRLNHTSQNDTRSVNGSVRYVEPFYEVVCLFFLCFSLYIVQC